MTSTISGRQFVGSQFLFRIGFMGLVMILLLGSVGQARAIQQPEGWPYSLLASSPELDMRKRSLCIGDEVQFFAELFEFVPTGPKEYFAKRISGAPVTALVTGGTGDVSPEKVTIGFQSQMPLTAAFTFKAKKAGKEKIFFEALVPIWPTPLSGTPDLYVDHSVEFDVKKCKKKVNVIYDANLGAQMPGFSLEQQRLALLEDVIIEQDEAGVYHGSADLEWNEFTIAPIKAGVGDTGPVVDACEFHPVMVLSPAEITGESLEDTLSLTVTYTEVPYSVSLTCLLVGTQSVDHLLQNEATLAVVPSSGGVVRSQYIFPLGSGTWTTIVEPMEEGSSVSYTGDLVGWLPGWFETPWLLFAKGQ